MKSDYIEKRLASQIEYYRKKSVKCRNEYYAMAMANIIINATIPVLVIGIDSIGAMKYVVAAFSAGGSVISGAMLLRKPQEAWVQYRSTYEKLKKEKILFETSSGKYAHCTEKDFICACEEIMESEHNEWKKIYGSNDGNKE